MSQSESRNANDVCEFKSNTDHSTLLVYERPGDGWFVKHTPKYRGLKNTKEQGPFKDKGNALLSVCMRSDLKFSDFKQVYPKRSPEGQEVGHE